MEALAALTTLTLFGLVCWFMFSCSRLKTKVSKQARQLAHQQLVLTRAHHTNRRILTERDAMRAKFLRAAQYVEQLEHKLEQPIAPTFSPEDLKTLIMLCHPDRHGGKESAHRITQVLLKMR